jgi:hypothetical protein
MNRFLLILILTLSYQSLTKAEDISDLQIEEMSIGDNLLTHVNLKTIKNSRKYTYKSNKFYSMDLILDKFNTYYAVQVHLKKDDNKYQIYGLSGAIKFGKSGVYYPKSKDECKKQMHTIENTIDKMFSDADKDVIGEYSQGDYDPKAIKNDIYYSLDTGEIFLQCVTYSKKFKKKEYLFDNLRVSILTKEFDYWLSNEAY